MYLPSQYGVHQPIKFYDFLFRDFPEIVRFFERYASFRVNTSDAKKPLAVAVSARLVGTGRTAAPDWPGEAKCTRKRYIMIQTHSTAGVEINSRISEVILFMTISIKAACNLICCFLNILITTTRLQRRPLQAVYLGKKRVPYDSLVITNRTQATASVSGAFPYDSHHGVEDRRAFGPLNWPSTADFLLNCPPIISPDHRQNALQYRVNPQAGDQEYGLRSSYLASC
jgi:hypothetical protein